MRYGNTVLINILSVRYASIPATLFKKNREKLGHLLPNNSLAVFHANDEMPRNGDCFFPYRPHSDVFYLTGLSQEKLILCLLKNAKGKVQDYLFTIKPTPLLEKWQGHKYTPDEIKAISDIQQVLWLEEFDTYLKKWLKKECSIYINLNENARFSSEVPYRDVRFFNRLKTTYGDALRIEKLAPLMTSLRIIKDAEELVLIRKACQITQYAFERILSFVKPQVYEYEIEAEITHEFVRRGAQHAYDPIVASGKNACILHYTTNNQLCQNNALVLLDFGAEYGYYASDCTRTIPVNGVFSPRQKACYQAVLDVFYYAKSLLKPGITLEAYHKQVCVLMEEKMISLGLFSKEEVAQQPEQRPLYFTYYMHGTSHFIGLDVHDVGSKQVPLQEGMVISCEPGIYIEEEGIGIRLENTLLITATGCDDLMKNIPIEIADIERLMKQ